GMASTHCRRVALATLFIGLDTLTTVFAMRTARYLTRVPHRPRRASNVKGRSGESRRLVICRQREAKFTATALAAPRPDLPALRLDESLTHGEADAESLLVRRRPARAIERGEHCVDLVIRNADAAIEDRHEHVV